MNAGGIHLESGYNGRNITEKGGGGMARKNDQEKNYGGCEEPKGHRDHMCNLMERGQTAEIQERSTHPAYRCANCDALANDREDLCNPTSLGKG